MRVLSASLTRLKSKPALRRRHCYHDLRFPNSLTFTANRSACCPVVIDSTNPYAPSNDTNADVRPDEIPHLDPPQTIQYRMTADMLAAYWTHRTLSSPGDNRIRNWAIARSTLVSVAATVALILLAQREVLSAWIAGPVALLFLVRVALIFNARRRATIRDAFAHAAHRLLDESPNRHMLSDRKLTLETEGVRQQLDASDSIIRWRAFERIEHDDDYLFLYESSFTAVVIPRTAFATRGRYLAFVALAEQLWQASGVTDQPSPNVEAV